MAFNLHADPSCDVKVTSREVKVTLVPTACIEEPMFFDCTLCGDTTPCCCPTLNDNSSVFHRIAHLPHTWYTDEEENEANWWMFSWARDDDVESHYKDLHNAVMHKYLCSDIAQWWRIGCITRPSWEQFWAENRYTIEREYSITDVSLPFYFPLSPPDSDFSPPISEKDFDSDSDTLVFTTEVSLTVSDDFLEMNCERCEHPINIDNHAAIDKIRGLEGRVEGLLQIKQQLETKLAKNRTALSKCAEINTRALWQGRATKARQIDRERRKARICKYAQTGPSFFERNVLPTTTASVADAAERIGRLATSLEDLSQVEGPKVGEAVTQVSETASTITNFLKATKEGLSSAIDFVKNLTGQASVLAILGFIIRGGYHLMKGDFRAIVKEIGMIGLLSILFGPEHGIHLNEIVQCFYTLFEDTEYQVIAQNSTGDFLRNKTANVSAKALEWLKAGRKFLDENGVTMNLIDRGRVQCGGIIIAVILCAIHGRLPTPHHLFKHLGEFGRAAIGFKCALSTIEYFTTLLRDEATRAQSGLSYEEVELTKSFPELAQFLAAHDVITSTKFKPAVLNSSAKACEMILRLVHVGEQLETRAIDTDNKKLQTLLRSKMNDLRKLRDRAQNARSTISRDRKEPMTVYLYGKPGQGKSVLQQVVRLALFQEFFEGKKEYDFTANTCYMSRKSDNEYWEGYRGQPIVEYDDIFQRIDSVNNPNPEIMEIIGAVNCAPYHLHMAGMDSKANTFFTSEFIVATSNVRKPIPKSIAAQGALHRRLHYACEVTAKKEFTTKQADGNTVVDPTKVTAYQKLNKLPIQTFEPSIYEVQRYDVSNDNVLGSVMSVQDFITDLLDVAKKRRQHSAQLTDSIRDFVGVAPPADDASSFVDSLSHFQIFAENAVEEDAKEEEEDFNFSDLFDPEIDATIEPTCGDQCILPDGIRGMCTQIKVDMLGVKTVVHEFCSLYAERVVHYAKVLPEYFAEQFKYWAAKCSYIGQKLASKVSLAWKWISEFLKVDKVFIATVISAFATFMGLTFTSMKKRVCPIEVSSDIEELNNFRGCDGACDVCDIVFERKICHWHPAHPDSELFDLAPARDLLMRMLRFAPQLNLNVSRIQILLEGVHKHMDVATTGYVQYINTQVAQSRSEKTLPSQSIRFAHSRSEKTLPSQTIKFAHSRSEKTLPSKATAYAHGGILRYLNRTPDVVSREQSQKLINQNAVLVKAWTRKEGGRLTAHQSGVFITGKILMVTKHHIKNRDGISILNPNTQDWMDVDLRTAHITPVLTQGRPTDLCLITIPNAQTRPSIIRYTIEADDVTKIDVSDCLLTGLRSATTTKTATIFCFETSQCQLVGTPFNYLHQELNEQVLLPRCFKYHVGTKAGDCGSLLFVRNKQINRKFAGLHVCGDSTGYGYATIVTKEMLLENLETHARGRPQYETIDGELPLAEGGITQFTKAFPDQESIEGDALVLGYGRQPRAAAKSELRESAIFGKVIETMVKPAALLPIMTPNGRVDPMEKGFKKVLSPQQPMQVKQSSIDRAVQEVKNIHATQPEGCIRAVLDLETTLWGNEEAGINPINRKTSPGYPYTLTNNQKGKTHWLGSGDDKFITDELLADVEALEESCKAGKRGNAIFTATLKDEKRPIAKVNEGKTRVFAAAPQSLVILVRKYFHGFAGKITLDRIRNEVGVGTNVYSKDWHNTGETLSVKGKHVIAGDFSNFDGSLRQDLLWKVFEVIDEWYDDGNTLIRSVLFDHLCNADVLMKGKIFRLSHSQPSGNPLTVVINSLFNQLVMRIAFHELSPEVMNFRTHVSMQCYGDDNVLNISESAISWYNQRTITEALARIGLTYTDEGKTGEVVASRTLPEVRYLKRAFVDNDGFFEGPLPLDNVLDQTNWVKGNDIVEATQMNIQCAFQELALFPEEIYKRYVRKIVRAASEQGISVYPDEYQTQRDKLEDLVSY